MFKRSTPLVGSIIILSIVTSACGLQPTPTTGESQLATIVAATMQALPTDTALLTITISPPEPSTTSTSTNTPNPTLTAAPTSTPLLENVKGRICYPGSSIPPMVLYFEETEDSQVFEMPIAESQQEYAIKIPAGTYISYAWLTDFSHGGIYSRAVACGLGTNCDDHSVLPFEVSEKVILERIDICDWFAGPFNVPYPPGKEPTELTGIISGNLSYIEDQIPELRVVAFNTKTNYWYWVFTLPGQPTYVIRELPPGIYVVVAYDGQGNAGGYADHNHRLIEVSVSAGKTTDGVHITDWGAPSDAFPPDPTR